VYDEQGRVYAVDVEFRNADIEMSFNGSTDEDCTDLSFRRETRSLVIRFETDAFVPREDGGERDVRWRIADIDNYLASKLYTEFYRELPEEEEE
jgi:hypothetical protein